LLNVISVCRGIKEHNILRHLLFELPTVSATRTKVKCNMDLAGKYPLAQKLHDLGMHNDVYVEYCIEGGLLQRENQSPDGMKNNPIQIKHYIKNSTAELVQSTEYKFLEIKGAILKKVQNSELYQFVIPKKLAQNSLGASTHFIFVCREENPRDWENLNFQKFWVGYVKIRDFTEYLQDYYSRREPQNTSKRTKRSTQQTKTKKPSKVWNINLDVRYKDNTFNTRSYGLVAALSRKVQWCNLNELTRDIFEQWFD